jgi:drug/metabolite transporter (DMT)-like permease
MKTPLGNVLLVLLASFIGSFGAAFLKSGAEMLRHGWHYLFHWKLAAGVGLFLLSSYFFVLGIRPPGELSVLYPMVSLGYIWTLLWARIFFHEPFTREKFFGLFLIVAGVFCVGMGSQ